MRLLVLSLAVISNFAAASSTPATLIPQNEQYYSREALTQAEKDNFDYIVSQIGAWEDNAEQLGTLQPMKTIDLSTVSSNLSCSSLTTLLMLMRNDVQHVYTQYPPARNVVCDNNNNVQQFDFRYHISPSFAEYQTEIAQIEEKTKAILALIKPDMTEAQKVRLLHDQLLAMVSYGMSKPGPDNIRGAFLHNSVLCEGYARTLVYLLHLAGIDAFYVEGHADGGMHAWVKVKVDGLWYNIDPTWNDGMSGASFHHSYFLIADANLTSHVPNVSKFMAPQPTTNLATTDYPLSLTVYTPNQDNAPEKPNPDDNTNNDENDIPDSNSPSEYERVPTIYTETSFRGESFEFSGDIADLGVFSGKAFSYVIPTGWEVRFYQEPNYQGSYYSRGWLSGDLANFARYGQFVQSVKVLRSPEPGTTDPRSLVIYTKTNGSGNSLEITKDIPQLDAVFDDNLASFSIPEGWLVRFYEGANFEGGFYTRKYDSSDFNDFSAYGNKVSSIRILNK